MAAWLVPALKAVLPHLGTIVTVAAPVFTRRRPDSTDLSVLMQQQIAELQAAASQNSTHIHDLAEQLKGTIIAIDEAAAGVSMRMRYLYRLSLAAIVVSSASLTIAVYLMVAR